MSRLAGIGVRVEPATPRDGAVAHWGLGSGVLAILSEIADRLEQLAHDGTTATIDLRSLPMSPDDRLRLRDALGNGEIVASLHADGVSTMRETAIGGVWWIELCNEENEVQACFIEIAPVPSLLFSAAEDITRGAATLRTRLAAQAMP